MRASAMRSCRTLVRPEMQSGKLTESADEDDLRYQEQALAKLGALYRDHK